MLFDLIGTLVSLLSTYYFMRLNNKAWPLGMIATVINGGLYWHKGIYADMFLELCYFLSMCYGWHLWQRKHRLDPDNTSHRLSTLTGKQWLLLLLILCCVFVVIHYLLQTLSDSNVAFLDAASTSLSLVAQWLMCHKIIITWLLWFITDTLYAFMYLSKDLPFHCGLMLIYIGMALTGYLLWLRQAQMAGEQKAVSL
ncbi:MAG: nicotinamide riboside transporter PnuC [Legionellales bacterium]